MAASVDARTQFDDGNVDVLIVGCGPAGLTLATQLAAFPQIKTHIIDQRSGPLEVGQADGVACRSLEMFEAFRFAEKVMKEAYWVNEVAFWRPDGKTKQLRRADRIQDVEDDLSEMPHVILNQARVHDFYLENMRNSASGLVPDYSSELASLTYTDNPEYPLKAVIKCLYGTEQTKTVHARYVVGCDGARSKVRKSMGLELKGEAARQLWGVMDVLMETNFPDIRLKAAVQSASEGSLLVIPREGGYMVRLYIELDKLHDNERAADRNVNPELLIEKARAILAPYTVDVKEVAWWSAYEIGQRVCDGFDDVPDDLRGKQMPRIFIAGDACHTHSPKAGQGMNVSMADTFNLGWKLAAVLQGKAKASLLDTYTQERRAKAKELIDFDRDMARLFSAKPTTEAEAAKFQTYFKKHGRYTAGVEVCYEPSQIISAGCDASLAKGLAVGKRFHSALVTRLADAKKMQLGHTLKADGRWRLIAFAPSSDEGSANGEIAKLCHFLDEHSQSPLNLYTPIGDDPDSIIDFRAVFQTNHRNMQIETLPRALLPKKGRYGLIDYEKAFTTVQGPSDIFDLRGIDRDRGALVVVRPDQFVARLQPLCDFEPLTDFFARFMLSHGPDTQINTHATA